MKTYPRGTLPTSTITYDRVTAQLCELQRRRERLVKYLESKVVQEDWLEVVGAGVELREADQAIAKLDDAIVGRRAGGIDVSSKRRWPAIAFVAEE